MVTKHAAALTALLLAAAAQAEVAPVTGSPIAPARDGDIAIRQELNEARGGGTLASYDLFLARHPHHALAATARAERRALERRLRRRR